MRAANRRAYRPPPPSRTCLADLLGRQRRLVGHAHQGPTRPAPPALRVLRLTSPCPAPGAPAGCPTAQSGTPPLASAGRPAWGSGTDTGPFGDRPRAVSRRTSHMPTPAARSLAPPDHLQHDLMVLLILARQLGHAAVPGQRSARRRVGAEPGAAAPAPGCARAHAHAHPRRWRRARHGAQESAPAARVEVPLKHARHLVGRQGKALDVAYRCGGRRAGWQVRRR